MNQPGRVLKACGTISVICFKVSFDTSQHFRRERPGASDQRIRARRWEKTTRGAARISSEADDEIRGEFMRIVQMRRKSNRMRKSLFLRGIEDRRREVMAQLVAERTGHCQRMKSSIQIYQRTARIGQVFRKIKS